jgi:putative endonuclease
MSEYVVYIIRNPMGLHYIGHSNNIEDRLKRHNENRNKYTKNKGPWELVQTHQTCTKREAYQLEMKLKNMKNSQKAIEYLKKLNK